MTAQPLTADYAPGRRVPLRAILGGLRHGGGDPTWRQAGDHLWRAAVTPEGPVSLRLHLEPATGGDRVVAQAYGPGADWTLQRLPALLGDHDPIHEFVAHHKVVAECLARQPDWRLGRSGLVIDSLVPAILEQRVTGRQAFAAYRTLVWRFGAPAPGQAAELGLRTPPDVAGWARIPSWEWLRAGVDAQRADTVMRAMAVAPRLQECAELPREQAWRRLRAIPGIGVWTAAEVAQRALGDADAVSYGDYHVAKNIGYVLTGAEVDDHGLAKLLEPYAGHRYRVQYLIAASGLGRPRHGSRLSLPTHLPTRF
ncbi:DNA-3-methyladenine glycosylase [Yimella sp. cx-51]|uniref:DNA-3-methyladenine glycosylase family protein n=1 Tax=Yimella sp. cx-51 TaxID=2770551 RepID=UPI001FCCB747|nr:DNA-3-methyladenine glycosylase 2 family protein [Yimella sp. cx-51]